MIIPFNQSSNVTKLLHDMCKRAATKNAPRFSVCWQRSACHNSCVVPNRATGPGRVMSDVLFDPSSQRPDSKSAGKSFEKFQCELVDNVFFSNLFYLVSDSEQVIPFIF